MRFIHLALLQETFHLYFHNSAALKKTADHVTMTHHKLLLCSTHGGASLSVLMGPDQKLHQAGNGTLLSERGVVGRAQRQVTD